MSKKTREIKAANKLIAALKRFIGVGRKDFSYFSDRLLSSQIEISGGITIRDIEINDYITFEKIDNDADDDETMHSFTLSVDDLSISFESNVFDEEIDDDYDAMPSAYVRGGFLGIRAYDVSKFKIKSIGTPYFAECKKFSEIALRLKEKGLNVDVDYLFVTTAISRDAFLASKWPELLKNNY